MTLLTRQLVRDGVDNMNWLTEKIIGWLILGFCAVVCIAVEWFCAHNRQEHPTDMEYLLREQDDA